MRFIVSLLSVAALEAEAHSEGEAARQREAECVDRLTEVLIDAAEIRSRPPSTVFVGLGIDARVRCPERQIASGCCDRHMAEPESFSVRSRHVVGQAQLAEAEKLTVLILIETIVGRQRFELVCPLARRGKPLLRRARWIQHGSFYLRRARQIAPDHRVRFSEG